MAMSDVPSTLRKRRNAYCRARSRRIEALRGWGLDGYIWQTTDDTIVKVFRKKGKFTRELAVYRRLSERKLRRLRGFAIPVLVDYDEKFGVLELSYVSPPFILDFAEATLDRPPAEFFLDSPEWVAEKRRIYGDHWPDVALLLDSLRQIGIFYPDVHEGNIRVRRLKPTAESPRE